MGEPRSPQPGQKPLDVVEGMESERAGRPWLGVWFSCANRYVKVFRSPGSKVYVARCPKCGEAARFRVGEGGMDTRFFEVSC